MNKFAIGALAMVLLGAGPAVAAETTLTVNAISDKGVGKPLGTVTFADTSAGMTIRPNLKALPAGAHGFHIHQNPDCGAKEQDGKMVAGLAAGGHYDPADAKAHLGPHAGGHLGDLPALFVDANGTASSLTIAPRLKVADLKGHALVIHAGGDNYADKPAPLGGGGARMACGLFTIK